MKQVYRQVSETRSSWGWILSHVILYATVIEVTPKHSSLPLD